MAGRTGVRTTLHRKVTQVSASTWIRCAIAGQVYVQLHKLVTQRGAHGVHVARVGPVGVVDRGESDASLLALNGSHHHLGPPRQHKGKQWWLTSEAVHTLATSWNTEVDDN